MWWERSEREYSFIQEEDEREEIAWKVGGELIIVRIQLTLI